MKKKILIQTFIMLSGIFFFSCGMEEVYTVEAPTVTHHNPLVQKGDHEYVNWYFSFKTAPSTSESGSIKYLGTDVYYKIYNNLSNLTSQRNAITSVNTESNGSAAATKMIETYTYQQLGTSVNTGNTVFFPEVSTSTVLRLKTYYPSSRDSTAATASNRYITHACVGVGVNNSATEFDYNKYAVIPYRNGNTKSFDFFDDDEDNKGGTRDVQPENGDSDFYYSSSSTEENTYYVQLFAVACVWDTANCVPSYSLVLDLGSIPIRKGE